MINSFFSNGSKLSLNINRVNLIIICICFFFMGFFVFKITLAMFALYFLLNINRFPVKKISKKEFLIYFYFIFTLFVFYIISKINGFYKEGFDVTEPSAVLIFCILGGLIFLFSDAFQKKIIIVFLILGYGLYCFYAVFYNIYYLNVASVYSSVYNPFNDSFENSPKFANFLIIFNILILFLFKNANNFFQKLILFLSFIFVFQIGVFTGSRSFILINVIFLFYILLTKGKIYLIISSIFLFLFFIFLATKIDLLEYTVFQRLSEKGLDSSRWDLYNDAIYKIITNPFGGIVVEKNIYGTTWYHNFFLDIGRMAGLFSLISFIVIYVICIVKTILSQDEFLKLVFFTVFLVMQQDVIFSGIYGIFIISFFLCLLSFAKDNE